MNTFITGKKFITLGIGAMLMLGAGVLAAADHQHHRQGGDPADPHAHHRAMMKKPSQRQSVDVRLIDNQLLTQEAEKVSFKSEVIGDKIVVVDFVYTTCTTVCPVLTAVFKQVQERLGGRLGQEVYMVSLSVDPTRDTPQRLKAYSKRYDVRPGWIWLTGQKTSVDEVLKGLGAYTPAFEDHPAMVLVGDGRSGEWARFYGFPSPDQILAKVDELIAARKVASSQGG